MASCAADRPTLPETCRSLRSAVHLAGLAAELIQIGAGGKLGHGTSPHVARARVPARLKTVLLSSIIMRLSGGGLGPSRGPGGALPRRCPTYRTSQVAARSPRLGRGDPCSPKTCIHPLGSWSLGRYGDAGALWQPVADDRGSCSARRSNPLPHAEFSTLARFLQ